MSRSKAEYLNILGNYFTVKSPEQKPKLLSNKIISVLIQMWDKLRYSYRYLCISHKRYSSKWYIIAYD